VLAELLIYLAVASLTPLPVIASQYPVVISKWADSLYSDEVGIPAATVAIT